ncbi:heme biosynthesis protein HemY [Celeribacter arenosi]|uniref:Heme biosynthesis HemY N-terminal domain-containing protein n=1 Tax=Celeribacter arenosi TaxID=792649 RepID=A0ABP7JXP0_9RHOB
MLWSLVKIVLFVLIVAALAYGGGLLLESEGSLQLSFAGYEVTLQPLQAVIALALFILACWVLLKVVGLLIAFVKFLLGDETAISRYFDRNRERKGFEALADGMMALASGEGRVAMTKAAKAEKYLRKPELTNLLTAQAAELSGDRKKAEQVYRKLVANDRTRFVGVRGILKQKLEEGDTDTALKLAEKAFALKPKHVETQDVLLKLQAEKGDWASARKTLSEKLRHGAIPRDVHKRRDAVLALSEAKGVLEDGATIEAREAAIEANKKSPDLIPAAVMAADAYVQEGKPRQATRVLKKAWEVQPHPDLAAAFARIASDETPDERVKRFRTLTRAAPNHPETKMLQAELLIAAEDFPEARRAIGDLAQINPTARSLTILAAIERGEGSSDVVVRGWLTRALTAPRGPQWVCDNCQTVHADWAPVCEDCGGFDTMSWRKPNRAEVSMPAGTEMLPMIVGTDPAPVPDDAEIEGEIETSADAVEVASAEEGESRPAAN